MQEFQEMIEGSLGNPMLNLKEKRFLQTSLRVIKRMIFKKTIENFLNEFSIEDFMENPIENQKQKKKELKKELKKIPLDLKEKYVLILNQIEEQTSIAGVLLQKIKTISIENLDMEELKRIKKNVVSTLKRKDTTKEQFFELENFLETLEFQIEIEISKNEYSDILEY